MLDAKLIEKSRKPWPFPIVLVQKKDGTKRFCVDYLSLNEITQSNACPLAVIDEILATLGGAKYFPKLDLKSSYWQMEIDD